MSVKIGVTTGNFSLAGRSAELARAPTIESNLSGKITANGLSKPNESGKNIDIKAIENALRRINSFGPLSQKIQFSFSEKLGELYVKVLDAKTGIVIGQIPSKEMMRLEENMREMTGIILDKKE